MGKIEKYFGIEEKKKISESRLNHRSRRYLAKLEETQILKEVNMLYSRGNTAQCFSLLEQAVKLVPNDPSPFYILGLIHEENQKYEKAAVAYTAAAILKRNDVSLWKKAYEMASKTSDNQGQVLSIEKIYRKEPSKALLLKKMEILKRMRKKYNIIACQIEMFDYEEIDNRIFDKFDKTRHINSLKKICSRLFKCIKKNGNAQNEFFIQKTILNLYKIREFDKILYLFDGLYFKNGFTVTAEIRLIYFITASNINDYRYDPLLDFKNLIEDLSIWNRLEDVEYVYDLANFYKENGDKSKYVQVLEAIFKFRRSHRVMKLLAEHYFDMGLNEFISQHDNLRIEPSDSKFNEEGEFKNTMSHTMGSENRNLQVSLNLYHQILMEDPINDEVKSMIYKIYKEMGNEEMALQFETTNKVKEYIISIEDCSKQPFRYTEDKCKIIRNAYLDALKSFDDDPMEFPDKAAFLLDDFFRNPFVILKNKNFKAFSNRHEKIISSSIALFNEHLYNKRTAEHFIRISSLHGLDVDEWFLILKYSMFGLIYKNELDQAFELFEKSLDAEIFKYPSEFMIQILFIGLRLSLMTKDFDRIVDIIRRMIYMYDYSAIYLLYAITHLFPEFYLNKSYSLLNKNIHRLVRMSLKTKPSDLSLDPENDCYYESKMHSITQHMGLSSFLPRFLQTETVDFINEYKKEDSDKINLIAGIINISHTKSRTLLDKKLYARQGITHIKNMPSEGHVKAYNLAKSYHFFGFFEQAENLYLQVIENGVGEIRRMAIYNLLLIFRKNKSRKIILRLISKFYDEKQ